MDLPDLPLEAKRFPMLDVNYTEEFNPFKEVTTIIRTLDIDYPDDSVDDLEFTDDEYQYLSSDVFHQEENSDAMIGSQAQYILHILNLKDSCASSESGQRRSLLGSWPKAPWEILPVCIFVQRSK